MCEISELLSHLVEKSPALFANLYEQIHSFSIGVSPDSCSTPRFGILNLLQLWNLIEQVKGRFKKKPKVETSSSQARSPS